MMDGWRKRMVDSGDTINLDDLTHGMNLGAEMPSVPKSQNVEVSELHEANDRPNTSSGSEGKLPDPLESLQAPGVDDNGIEALAAEIPKAGAVLQARSGNARPAPSPRKVSFLEDPEIDAMRDDYDDAALLDFSGGNAVFSPLKAKPEASSSVRSVILCCKPDDGSLLMRAFRFRCPVQTKACSRSCNVWKLRQKQLGDER